MAAAKLSGKTEQKANDSFVWVPPPGTPEKMLLKMEFTAGDSGDQKGSPVPAAILVGPARATYLRDVQSGFSLMSTRLFIADTRILFNEKCLAAGRVPGGSAAMPDRNR